MRSENGEQVENRSSVYMYGIHKLKIVNAVQADRQLKVCRFNAIAGRSKEQNAASPCTAVNMNKCITREPKASPRDSLSALFCLKALPFGEGGFKTAVSWLEDG